MTGIENSILPASGDWKVAHEQIDRKRLETASRDFEALLADAMLRSMRSTVEEDEESQPGFGKDTYTDMIYQQLAFSISRGPGLGIRQLLESQIQKVENGIPRAVELDMANPVAGTITSGFGWRQDPLTGGQRFHNGIDIAAAEGTPIVAASSGRVVFCGQKGQYGNVVIIEHDNGVQTLYAHLSERNVTEGQHVERLQSIGKVGTTGRSTGPHLHFEVSENQQLRDPLHPSRVV